MDIKELCQHVNPHIASALQAAATAVDTMTDRDLAAFQALCRPAEYIMLVRGAVGFELSKPNAAGQTPAANKETI